MEALIVGLGSIGRRHLANLRQLLPEAKITVCHQFHRPSPGPIIPESADGVVYHLNDALARKPVVALITGPASTHITNALALAEQGVHLFIEKPLSHTLEGVDYLLDRCRERSLVLLVGYNFRFYRPLQIMRQALQAGRIGRPMAVRAEVGQYLPEWRPEMDYRQTVSARKELGGGVILELSHELDYLRWLMGEVAAVSARVRRLSDLEIDVEDTAEIIVDFKSGALGSVHLNMVQRPASRTCRIIGTEGTLTWDGLSHQVRLFSARVEAWEDLHPAGPLDRNEMYLAELKHFLDCVASGAIATVDGAEGRRVLEIALAVKQSAQEHRLVAL